MQSNVRKILLLFLGGILFVCSTLYAQNIEFKQGPIWLSSKATNVLKGKKILYIERHQYANDHHNTATLFQSGEINENSFAPGGAMRIYDVDSKKITTLIALDEGVVRDPELSFDGKRVIFSMRKSKEDFYHIYEMNIDGTGLRQLTFAKGVSDIDPLYLPEGDIVFSSTRQPKYCMCNRHIMCNLFRMEPDGANITQIGVSTLFEGHASLLHDGRILYDRWEYVDRNFGDAQGLWTVNPDGTKHTIYYGNNTASPGGVIDARPIPGSDEVVCIFGSCHDRPWGAIAIINRNRGIDNAEPLIQIWPKESRKLVGNGNLDSFKKISAFYEDPFPIDKEFFLVSKSIWFKSNGWNVMSEKMGIYLIGRDGTEELLFQGDLSLFDPMVIEAREKPPVIPSVRNYTDKEGVFYVQNVYEGTHMKGVKPGSVKYLRLVESPEKRTWTKHGWMGEGEQAPAMNWHSFENKQVLGEVEVESDGSVSFKAPAGKHVYFQLLDKDKKMIQSMRSGVSLMPGETNGCIGCHEDRLQVPMMSGGVSMALKKKPKELQKWMGKEPVKFSFMEHVQPILDKRCISCHDFDRNNREKLVLARDKNPFFNAAYVNLYVAKAVKLVGGGPAAIQEPYSWGSHASQLSKIIESGHHGVKLNDEEKEVIYTWMDLNGVYYPVYETSVDNAPAGRSPLLPNELKEFVSLTGIDIGRLNAHWRNIQAQISFDRPKESPCLDPIRDDKDKFNRAVEILKRGQKRLKATPRGDIERELVPCDLNKQQLRKYAERMSEDIENSFWINTKNKRYDRRD